MAVFDQRAWLFWASVHMLVPSKLLRVQLRSSQLNPQQFRSPNTHINVNVDSHHLTATSTILTTTIMKAMPRYPRNVSMPILRWLDMTGRVSV